MEKHIEGAEDSMPPVVPIRTDEDVVRVEVRKESAGFERTPGAIFEIGDCGRFTVVLSEEWDAFQALGKEFFELNHTENGETIERLQLDRRQMLELVAEGAFVVGGRELSLIPVDFFARVFPPLKRDDGGLAPWQR